MWKPAKAILVASKEKSDIFLNSINNRLLFDSKSEIHEVLPSSNYQHLYIISLDKPKDGDLAFCSNGNIKQITKANINDKFIENWSKIIATTDKSLSITTDYKGRPETKLEKIVYSEYLPQIPQQFIELFIEEYNKNTHVKHSNQISLDVLVEYESCNECIKLQGQLDSPDCCHNYQLVINRDNTISIKTVKDSFSRDRIIKLKNKLISLPKEEQIKILNTVESFDKWIEQNL